MNDTQPPAEKKHRQYNVTKDHVEIMIGILQRVAYTEDGKHVHEMRLGPLFTNTIRELLKEMGHHE